VPPPPVQAPPAAAAPEVEADVKAIQMHNAYLVLETPEGMLVIDQHALHERILFEQIKQRVRTGTLESQQLLIPEPVDLTAEQAARTLEHRQELAELGLGVEEFGGGTVLVTRYPALLGRRSPGEILKRVVDHLVAKERLPTREQLLNDLMSLMACHAAVRSGDPLTPEEITSLAAQRHLAQDAHHCPHGRPTALLFTRQELDRQFRRT
jgi:DNA mismatch repair protein MutL